MAYPPGLGPYDFWREPSAEIEVGDVFIEVPQLSMGSDFVAVRDEQGEIYLATERVELALLLKMLPGTWWFVPVLTRASFEDASRFQDVVERSNWGVWPGSCVLAPYEELYQPAGESSEPEPYPPLREFSVVFTLRPTIHRPEAFDDAHAMRVASLSQWAYRRVVRAFLEGFVGL
jgi:hypothetical protein